MRKHASTLLTLTAALALAAVLVAAPAAFQSGPKPGDTLPGPFRPYNVTGKERHKGRFHCLVSEHGLNPVVLILVHGTNPSDKLLDLLKSLDETIQKNPVSRLAGFVVFLSDDLSDVVFEDDRRAALASEIEPKVAPHKSVAAALDSWAKVKEQYKLHDEAEVTVVLYNKLKVLSNHAFAAEGLNEDGVQAVLTDVNNRLEQFRLEALGKVVPMKK
jgi:hypothetical protein